MRLTFSNTLIASENLALGRVPFGATSNGQPVFDPVAYFRAATTTIFGRHDGPEEYTQRVWRFFGTEAAALTFWHTHRSALPLQADLAIIDDGETVAFVMADAVREVRMVQRIGLAVLVDYKWIGSGFTSEDVPEGDINELDDIVKTGLVTLSAAAESGSVAFAVAFGSVPKVQLQICPPTGGASFDAYPIWDTITASGFDYVLNAPVPASGTYKLSWKATL